MVAVKAHDSAHKGLPAHHFPFAAAIVPVYTELFGIFAVIFYAPWFFQRRVAYCATIIEMSPFSSGRI